MTSSDAGWSDMSPRQTAGGPSGVVRRPVVLRILVFVFVVSTAFDSFSFQFTRATDTLSRVLGMLLLAAFLFRAYGFRPKVRFFSRTLKWFYVFFGVIVLRELALFVLGSGSQSEMRGFVAYLQLMAMVVILQDLTRDARIYKSVLTAVMWTYGGMSILTTFNVATVTFQGSESRIGVAGINLNQLAYFYAVISVCLISWLLAKGRILNARGLVSLSILAFLVFGIARTGSRGGAAALVVGLLVAAVVNLRAARVSRYVIFLPLLVAGLAYFLVTQGALAQRVERTVETGDTGTREQILDAGLDLARERPIAGYGTMYGRNLGRELGYDEIAAHNTYLQIALSFGMLGMVPFLCAIAGLARMLWQWRESVWGGTWLAVLMMTLVFGFVGHFADAKYFWILVVLLSNVGVLMPNQLYWRRAYLVTRQGRPRAPWVATGQSRGWRQLPQIAARGDRFD